jgi:hypothetical protein
MKERINNSFLMIQGCTYPDKGKPVTVLFNASKGVEEMSTLILIK